MARKISHDDFINEVKRLVGSEYNVIGEYEGTDTKLLMKHEQCGNEYLVTPYKFKSGRRCPKCAGNQRKTHEQFTCEFNEISKGEYTLLGIYKNAKTKVKVRHNLCGHLYEVTPDTFINRKRKCPACNEKAFRAVRKKSHDQFESEFNDLSNGDYELLSKYKRDDLKIKVRHVSCGRVYEVKASSFIQGRRCKPCQMIKAHEAQTRTQEEFEALVRELGLGEYEVIGQYTKSANKISMKHIVCGTEYEVKANEFIQGSRCTRCQSSRGEIKVELFLRRNGYKYEPQYRIDECRHIKPLPFDFAVFNNDGKVVSLIEYEGRQHFAPIEIFGGEEEFLLTQKRDRIKREFCKNNNIPLIEIPYTIKDVDSFLESKLKCYANPEPSAPETV